MPDDIEQPPRGYTTDDVKAIPDEEPEPRRRRRFGWRSILVSLIVIAALGLGLWTWISLNWAYSDGERVGYVQKLARKGWLCKTWEGELAMANVPGSMPQLFYFTVRDDAVAQQINAAAGKRVSLHYEQRKGVPTTCFGETSYHVQSVRTVQ